MSEHESFLEHKKRKKLGARGQLAQNKVQDFFTEWKLADPLFDFDRLYDTRSTGGRAIIPEQVADFTYTYRGRAGAVEVKQSTDPSRLEKSKFKQYPLMVRRAKAGAAALLVIYYPALERWRIIDVARMQPIKRGSWPMNEVELRDLEDLKYEIIRRTHPDQ